METDYRNGACPQYEALLEDFVDGVLDGSEAKKLAEHLNCCAGCRTALDEAEKGAALLRVASPARDPGPGFSRVVMARIHAAKDRATAERTNFWQSLVALEWRFAAMAVLVVAAMLTYDIRWNHASHPQPMVGQQTEVRDLFSPSSRIVPVTQDDVLIMIAETDHGNN